MSSHRDVPADPAELSTAAQFGRFLANHIRGSLTQRKLSKNVEQIVRQRTVAGLRPLSVQRISGMENLETGRLPTSDELFSYLYGCGQVDKFEDVDAACRRLRRDLLAADQAREAAGASSSEVQAVAVRRSGPVSVALAGLPAEEGFTGRTSLLKALDAVLAPDADSTESIVVSTVAGLAGIGKTALVVRSAYRAMAAGWFSGGVLFIDLHGYDPGGSVEPSAALAALLGALGIAGEHIPATQGEREALYRSELAALARQGKRVLIVADNASGAGQILPLRPGASTHRMVVTSRHTLAVPGARRVEVDLLPAGDATAVLTSALRAANPGDTRPVDEPDAMAALVRLCGYLPLALRITAELLADRPERPIAELVGVFTAARDRLGELAYGDSAAVRVAFQSSYQHLPAEQARMFRLLALYPGTFIGLEAAAALADVSEDSARHLLVGLRRAHLLYPSAIGQAYEFHDLVGMYAAEQCDVLETTADRDLAVNRLLWYYRQKCQATERHLGPAVMNSSSGFFDDRAAALAWLEDERPNLPAVVGLAVRAKQDEDAFAIAYALRFFYNFHSYQDDWIVTGQAAVSAAQRLGNRSEEANALNALAAAYLNVRQLEESLKCGIEALAISRELGDRVSEAKALINVGNPHYELHNWNEALERYLRALHLFRELRNTLGTALALNNLAFTYRHLHRFDEAVECFEQSIAAFGEMGDRLSLGVPLTNLGGTYQDMGRFGEALVCHEQALEVFVQFADRRHEAWALNNLGATFLGLGRLDDAVDYHRQALAIRRETGDKHGQGVTLADLGAVHRHKGEFDEALTCYQQALNLFTETRDAKDAEQVHARVEELISEGQTSPRLPDT